MSGISLEDVERIINDKRVTDLDPKRALESLLKGKPYMDILGISQELMGLFSSIALEYLDNRQYSEAGDCFFLLAMLNPLESEYWIRLGNAEQALMNPENSLHAYSMAIWLNADDPFPHLYTAQVLYLLGDKKKAEQSLKISLSLLKDNSELREAETFAADFKKAIRRERKKE